MRIWILAQDTRPPVVPGITRHYALGRELVRRGHEVLVVNGGYDHLGPVFPDGRVISAPERHEHDGVQFLTIPVPRYQRSISAGRLWNNWLFGRRAMATLSGGAFGRPDVVVGSTVHPWAAEAGRKLARRFGVPFVYEVRDLWPQTLVELGRISAHHPLVLFFRRIDRRCATEAAFVVVSAPLMALSYAERFGMGEEKFLWITNGVRVGDFDPTPPPPHDGIDVYYTGGLNLSNQVDRLFEMILSLDPDESRGIRWTFVGKGEMRPALERLAAEKQMPVRFLDPVPKCDVPHLLAQADAFVAILDDLPIYRYGISLNKLADYFAAGRPVLFVGECAKNPVVRSEAGWAVRDAEGFRAAVRQLSALSTEARCELGAKARRFALEEYDWEGLADAFLGRLQRTCDARHTGESRVRR